MAVKKPVKKTAAKKAASKKVSTKKPAVKKAAVKKVTTKKAVVKKAVVKKSAVKRSSTKKTATPRKTTKKATSSRTATKRITSGAVLDRSVRSQSIPGVPIRRDFTTKTPGSPFATKSEIQKYEVPTSISPVSTSRAESKQNRNNRVMLTAAAIIIVIAGVVAFAVPSSSQDSAADGSNLPSVEESVSPSPETTVSSEPSRAATESAPSDNQTPNAFGLRFSYNSIGINLNFSTALQSGAVKEFIVKSTENGASSKVLATFPGDISSARITKIDTVGKTQFTVVAVLEDGSKIQSKPLAIRGLFILE